MVEVTEELLAGQRYIKASRRRIYRNKAHYSLDAEDGIEYKAFKIGSKTHITTNHSEKCGILHLLVLC